MKLSHWSENAVIEVEDREQVKHPSYKPEGFWVSVDGEQSWDAWCGDNAPEWIDCIQHRVVLREDANLLIIDTSEKMQAFNAEYKEGDRASLYNGIDWAKVAEKYDGIIIAPYQYSYRLNFDTFWYYGWDCASGCIWRSRAVSSISSIITAKELEHEQSNI